MQDIFTLKEETGGESGGFVVIMLSLNLIILAFFILLNALSTPVEGKQAAAIYGLQEGFDYRSSEGKVGDDFTTQMGPAWVVPVESQVTGLVRDAWPGAEMSADAQAGVIEVNIALSDAWGEGAFDAGFVTMVQNLLMVLKDVPDVSMRVAVESGVREDLDAMFAASVEQLPDLGFGWEIAPRGAVGDVLKLVIEGADNVPDEAASKAQNLMKNSGGRIERIADE